jgi:hypothetical protein
MAERASMWPQPRAVRKGTTMSDDANAPDQPTQPSEAIVALDRLVGSWTVTGERHWVYPGGGGYSSTVTRS